MSASDTSPVRDLAGIYLRGFCMGAADAVPGVSGGTVALITGIYDRLLSAITAVEPDRVARILRGVRRENRGDALAAIRETDPGFLLALGAGMATAVVVVLRLVSAVLASNPVATYGFFFGLIAASAVVLFEDVSLSTRPRRFAALSGFCLAIVVSGRASVATGTSLPLVFLAGAVAVSAMVLPGVSGSLLLLLLGQYEFMSDTLRAFTDTLGSALTTPNGAALVSTGVPITVFVSGALVGLVSVAHSVRWALDRYREATVAFLVSLIVGALRAPVEQAGSELGGTGWTAELAALFVGFGLVGAVGVGALNRFAGSVDTAAPA